MKNNKLLAEYIGGEFHEDQPTNKYTFPEKITRYEYSWLHESEWCPDKDWNQLMMVVEKIDKEPNMLVELYGKYAYGCDIYHCSQDKIDEDKENRELKGSYHGASTRIEAVYNACVEYIKQKP